MNFLSKRSLEIFKVFLLSIALAILLFSIEGNIGINLADEGFLWYGTIRTVLGEVPLRDFQSYDPGRYYWGSAWFQLFGNDGIMSLRLSNAIFQSLGLTFGLLCLKKVTRSGWVLTLQGILLLLWMYPRHKLFEPSIAMAAVYFAVLLIENPSLRQHLITGVFVGIAAFLGRNHGLYAFVSFFLLIIFIQFKLDRQNLSQRYFAWVSGIFIGYSPMFLMLFFIPHFWQSFIQVMQLIVRLRHTNIPLPIPWFWAIDYARLSSIERLQYFSQGLLFFILFLFNSFIIYFFLLKSDRLKNKTLAIASAFTNLTYMHYAFSRADLPHLAQSIHPMLIGLMAFPYIFEVDFCKTLKIAWFAILLAITIFAVGTSHPYYLQTTAEPGQYIRAQILNDSLWIDRETDNIIEVVKNIDRQLIASDEELLIIPHWTTLYPILQRQSPVWDIYLLFPETADRQQATIEELAQKKVNWVILGDIALDNRDELRFKNTHPLVWKHFMEEFEIIPDWELPDRYQLLHRKL